RLLRADRQKILRKPFARFVTREDSDRYHRLFASVMRHDERQAWELTLRRSDGSVFRAQLDCLRVAAGDQPPLVRVTLTDITERKAAEAEIEHLAFYDPLTQLPNRRLLLDRLQQALAACARSRRRGAILFLDLDDFKTLNDTRGHDVGDLLLQQVAQRLLA